MGVATILIEPRPYKCVGSGKNIDVNGYICECHQGFRGKKVCFEGVATILVEPRHLNV